MTSPDHPPTEPTPAGPPDPTAAAPGPSDLPGAAPGPEAAGPPHATAVGAEAAGPPPTYAVPVYAPLPAVPTPRPRRWLVVITTVWALVLAAAALWSIRTDGPTDREQTTIGSAKVTADRVAADVLAAAGVVGGSGGSGVADVGGFDSDGECRISAVRGGVRYSRAIDIFTSSGGEQRLLQELAAKLPAAYQASAAGTAEAPRLRADGGNYVGLTGTSVGPGQVRLVVDTGCRQKGGDLTEPTDPPVAVRGAVTEVLSLLGSPAVTWRSAALTCPNGNPLWTVAASGSAATVTGALDTTLARLATNPVLAAPDRVAWRTSTAARWATIAGGTLTVGVTTVC